MEREILDVLNAFDAGKITLIQAHQKICDIKNLELHPILTDLMKEQEEVISSSIRFNGVHVSKIKQVFAAHGCTQEEPF